MGREIRVEDVEKYYRNGRQVTKAVDRVSFTVEPGEFMGVMGASGSGKTTLLNLLATVDRVTAGHIYYQDTDFLLSIILPPKVYFQGISLRKRARPT